MTVSTRSPYGEGFAVEVLLQSCGIARALLQAGNNRLRSAGRSHARGASRPDAHAPLAREHSGHLIGATPRSAAGAAGARHRVRRWGAVARDPAKITGGGDRGRSAAAVVPTAGGADN